MLKQRVITALILAAVLLGTLFGLPPWGWVGFSALIAGAAAWEWAGLLGMQAAGRGILVAVTLALLGVLMAMPGTLSGGGVAPAWILAFCGTASLFWLTVAPAWLAKGWNPRAVVPMSLLGIWLLAATWLALVQLAARTPLLAFAAMAVVWVADIAAYFAGRRFGRRKLAPSISPGKTWEGVYGALAGAAAYACITYFGSSWLGYSGPRGGAALAAWIAATLFLAAVSVIGDLFESHLKRKAGVKDSSNLLPGHGGVLDRVDSLLAALPLAVLLIQLLW